MDTGDIIKIKEIKINEDDNFGSLYGKLRSLSGNFILDPIDEIQKVNGKPQVNHDFEIGKMYIESSNKLMVAVNKGAIEILSLKIEGKKRISGLDYINGLKNKTIKLI